MEKEEDEEIARRSLALRAAASSHQSYTRPRQEGEQRRR